MRASLLTFPLALAMLVGLTACSPKEEEVASHIYQMGEHVALGPLIYTVFERQWMTQIGTGIDARIPQNRFYLVRISAVNNGSAAAIIPTISLVDDTGTAFSELQSGDGVPDFIGSLRQVAPGGTVQGNLVFDVQQKHYKLKLSDEDGKVTALVDIPLSFDSDNPDVTPVIPDRSGDPTKK